ncbi:MAG: cytochrome c [Pseudomonadota bacterium]
MLAVMRPVALATAAALSMGVFQGAAADSSKGELLFETCLGCHGIPGYKNNYPTYKVPMLGGQSEQYIVDALTAYKNGARKHETMHAQASSLSTDDMRAIASYLSTTTEVSSEAKGEAPAAAAACSACHGPNGKAIAPNFPSLAGQHADYLEFSLKRYRSGERSNAIMAGFAGNLDDDTIKALAAYFSKQQDGLATVKR